MRVRTFLLPILCLSLLACQQDSGQVYAPHYVERPPSDEAEYSFGVHPLHNPQRLFEVFGPLTDYLSEAIPGARFRLQASRSYAAYDHRLERTEFDFALPNPYQTINALAHGYQVLAKMGDDDNFRGIILVRKDAGIHAVADLRGKVVAYPAPTALAATMLPQYYLQVAGLDVMHDIENRYVGSQESAIMSVYLGRTAAGATWPPPWQAFAAAHPGEAQALEVRWQTESLPNNGVVAAARVPPAVIARVRELLVHLHEHARGQAILKGMNLSRYEPANEQSYQPVREFIARFAREVRPPEEG